MSQTFKHLTVCSTLVVNIMVFLAAKLLPHPFPALCNLLLSWLRGDGQVLVLIYFNLFIFNVRHLSSANPLDCTCAVSLILFSWIIKRGGGFSWAFIKALTFLPNLGQAVISQRNHLINLFERLVPISLHHVIVTFLNQEENPLFLKKKRKRIAISWQ